MRSSALVSPRIAPPFRQPGTLTLSLYSSDGDVDATFDQTPPNLTFPSHTTLERRTAAQLLQCRYLLKACTCAVTLQRASELHRTRPAREMQSSHEACSRASCHCISDLVALARASSTFTYGRGGPRRGRNNSSVCLSQSRRDQDELRSFASAAKPAGSSGDASSSVNIEPHALDASNHLPPTWATSPSRKSHRREPRPSVSPRWLARIDPLARRSEHFFVSVGAPMVRSKSQPGGSLARDRRPTVQVYTKRCGSAHAQRAENTRTARASVITDWSADALQTDSNNRRGLEKGTSTAKQNRPAGGDTCS